jgi:hypothetical protein
MLQTKLQSPKKITVPVSYNQHMLKYETARQKFWIELQPIVTEFQILLTPHA